MGENPYLKSFDQFLEGLWNIIQSYYIK